MKTISISVADDGSRFDSEESCRAYEALCGRVKSALSPLGPGRDIPSMSYWQHSPSDVAAAWSAFYEVCKAELGNSIKWLHQHSAHEVHPGSYIGRVLSEMGKKCMSEAGYRFHCIDSEGREFDQPFWANYRKEQTLEKHARINP